MNKKILKIKSELEKALFKIEDPDSAEIVYSDEGDSPKFIVCAEVGYNKLSKICDALDEVIQRYDDGAYFEPEAPGRADCYLWNLNLEDSIKDGYYDEDNEDDSEEISDIDDENFFCVTLNVMSKNDAKFYGKTYGLFIRPARAGGYQLAGDEDQVKAMLEDYVGRYDKIGKILNEGFYVPSYNRDGFINPHKRYADSKKNLVKDSSTPIEDLLIKTDKKSGITLDHAIDDLKQRKGYNDSLLGDNLAINMLMKRFDLEKRDVVRVLNYKFDGKYLEDKKAKEGKNCYPSCDKRVKDREQNDDWFVKNDIDNVYYNHKGDRIFESDFELNGRWVFVPRYEPSKRRVFKTLDEAMKYADELYKNLKQDKVQDSKKTKTKDSLEGVVSDGAKEALAEYTEWEGIIGYDEDIIECYESGCAYVDDDYIDYEDSYKALDAYLKWEGILGYTDEIYDILKYGVESVYYDNMLRDKESYKD